METPRRINQVTGGDITWSTEVISPSKTLTMRSWKLWTLKGVNVGGLGVEWVGWLVKDLKT